MRCLIHGTRRFFNRDDIGNFRNASDNIRFHVLGSTTGDVVENDGNVNRFGHSTIVLIKAFARRLVVIGGNHHCSICTAGLGKSSHLDCFLRAVGTCSRHHLDSACGLLADDFDNAVVLIMGDRGAFPGRSHGTETIGSLSHMPVHSVPQCDFVYLAVLERSDDRHGQPCELFSLACHADSAFNSTVSGVRAVCGTHRYANVPAVKCVSKTARTFRD